MTPAKKMEGAAGASALEQWRASRQGADASAQPSPATPAPPVQGKMDPRTPRESSPFKSAEAAGGTPSSHLAAWRARRRMQERLAASSSLSPDKAARATPSPIRNNSNASFEHSGSVPKP